MDKTPRTVRIDPQTLTVGLTASGQYGVTFGGPDGAAVQVILNRDMARKLAGSLAMLITEMDKGGRA